MHLSQVIFCLAAIPDVGALDRGAAQPEAVPAQRGGVLVGRAAVPAVLALADHVREVVPRQGLHLIAILPDHEFRFSRANDHDLIRLERFTLVTYKKRGNIKRPYITV